MNTPAQARKVLHQDAIKATMDAWPESKQLLAYQYLFATGCRIDGIEFAISRALAKELETE